MMIMTRKRKQTMVFQLNILFLGDEVYIELTEFKKNHSGQNIFGNNHHFGDEEDKYDTMTDDDLNKQQRYGALHKSEDSDPTMSDIKHVSPEDNE